jgi:hypothetical protein
VTYKLETTNMRLNVLYIATNNSTGCISQLCNYTERTLCCNEDRRSAKILLLTIGAFLLSSGSAQIPDTLWTRIYGGASDERGHAVQQTSDGGYIIAGYTYSFGAGVMDFYLVKTDSLGDTLWTRTYGGPYDDIARSVWQTLDGGYIVTGSTKSYGVGYNNLYLVKTNEAGDTMWTKTFGWTNSDNTGYEVQQTTDGGYIIGGTSTTRMLLIKTDENGSADWIREYGITGHSGGYSVQQTSDGGYIVAGFSYVPDNYDFYLVRTNSVGDTLWTRTYGSFDYDVCFSVRETFDGGYIAAGGTGLLYDRYGPDIFLVRTNANGDTLWTRKFGYDNDDVAYSIQQTTDGGYIVVGRIYSLFTSDWDVYVVRTDQLGDTLWSRKYGTLGNQWATSVEVTSDGGYVIAGWTTGNYYDVYLLRMEPDPFCIKERISSPVESSMLSVGPNPFTKILYIHCSPPRVEESSITIYDVLGRSIKDFSRLSHAEHRSVVLSWDGCDSENRRLPSGVYFVTLQASSYTETQRVLLIR